MHPVFVKLVAVLLLVAQGLLASAPGRVLCIPLEHCETHHRGLAAACDHCDTAGCTSARFDQDEPGSGRGNFFSAIHPEEECGCHVHVPIPADQQVPGPANSGVCGCKPIFVPLVLAIVIDREIEPPVAMHVRLHPPDFILTDQVLALKSTRLLI
jgi:hypothetical protein